MERANLCFAWCWILTGLLVGAIQGLWFHREDWLGGYASWRRRMTRLGHVSFFGTGFLNLAFVLTARSLALPASTFSSCGPLLIAGAVGMPAVCYLAAWKKSARHLFPLPVAALIIGIALFLMALLSAGSLTS